MTSDETKPTNDDKAEATAKAEASTEGSKPETASAGNDNGKTDATGDSAWARMSDGDEAPGDAAETAQAELAETKQRLLHTLADMENLRRRTEREVADARKYAVTNFAREMLTVGDNLQRALAAVPEELRSGGDAAKSFLEGVEATARVLEQTLEKFGVKKVETKGAKFDPDFHQAMMEVDDENAEPGTVADEIQSGYAIGERVLRPAFVSVVKKRKAVKIEIKNGDAKSDETSSSAG